MLHLFCFVGRRLRGSRQARTAAHLLVFPLGSRPLGWREAGAGKCLPSLAQRNPLLHRPSARDRDQGYEPFPAPGGYRLRGQAKSEARGRGGKDGYVHPEVDHPLDRRLGAGHYNEAVDHHG